MQVSVIGLGYVGLPLAMEFARVGIRVTGVDVSPARVAAVNSGQSHASDVPNDKLQEHVDAGLISATGDFAAIKDCDAVCICVPTPLRKSLDPDISHIVSAVNEISRHLAPGMLIVLESTTYPGTTEEVVLPRLAETGMKVGRDFFLAFSPERVDPGNKKYTTRNTPKVVGGVTPACADRAAALYRRAIDTVVPVGSARAAEMVKLLENTFRAINIGLVNELAIICDRLNVDIWEVIEAAKTKPFGFMPFYPGPGLGGHCLPIDPLYLSWKLRTVNYTARFIDLASSVNSNMPEYVVHKLTDALNTHEKSVKGSRILILGVAYKKDVSDVRESPSLDIMALLYRKGAKLSYADPFVAELTLIDEIYHSYDLDEGLKEFDCVVIATDHTAFDYADVLRQSRLVYDCRNATAGLECPETCELIKL